MNMIVSLLVLASAISAGDSISGVVIDANGQPVAGARVFAEPGLAGALVETQAGKDGIWRFDNMASDNVGVFAIADGYAFGGVTVTARTGATNGLSIRLESPDTLSCKVADPQKKPVPGAQVTRVAVRGASVVGIPLAKLKAFGFDVPTSDTTGRIVIDRLPKGGRVALKVGHSAYAQEGVEEVAVGGSADIVLWPGIPVEGDVLLREGRAPVADVPVIIKNAQPPYDSTVAKSNLEGAFSIRLKPGVYMYQVVSPQFRTAGWERLTLTGEAAAPRLKVLVAGAGEIHGKVCDAVSGQPIAGARIILDTNGNAASVSRTGASGEFVIAAMAGENVVRLDAASGYCAPEQPALKIQVVEGKPLELPTFWLKPIPAYVVTVVDANMKPCPNVVITVLRPEQFGWRVTDAEGKVKLQFASLPPDGAIVGMAQQLDAPMGALFALKSGQTEDAKVQLLPLSTLSGHVVSPSGKPASGVVIASLFTQEAIPLWRTVSDPNGAFVWSCVIPQVPQSCVASQKDQYISEPVVVTPEQNQSKDLGTITLTAESTGAPSVLGKPLSWRDGKLLAGKLPDRKSGPAVVAYCESDDAAMAVEGMMAAQKLLSGKNIQFVVVVNGNYTGEASFEIPVVSGKAPGSATTYIVDASGKVCVETFGLPPLRALQGLGK